MEGVAARELAASGLLEPLGGSTMRLHFRHGCPLKACDSTTFRARAFPDSIYWAR
jgi:hypothetical protein